MPNINFELNLNQHPKNTPNRALIDAENVQLSDDLSCLQSEFSITEREDLAEVLSDKYIAGYIPCNKEFILFLAPSDYESQLEENSEGISIEIYRYKEKGDNAVDSFDYAVGKTIYNSFIWHGGKLKGTFTYNIKSHLIITVAESDTITGDLIPLKTMDLGTYDSEPTDGDNDLNLENGQLSLNPEVKIPAIKDYSYINGLAYKGWYYFFIRYKINSVDYTKWYSIGFPILLDSIEKYNIFNYNINQETEHIVAGGSEYELAGYTSIVNQLSSAASTCNSTIKLILDKFSTNFDKYQLAFINTTKDIQRAFKSLDIDINTTELVIDFSSLEEYSVSDITFEQYNYYNVKNVINYKNRLYLSNYIESKFDKNELVNFANNNIILDYEEIGYSFTDEVIVPDEEGQSSYFDNSEQIQFLNKPLGANLNCYPNELYNCGKEGKEIYEGNFNNPITETGLALALNLQITDNWDCSIKCRFVNNDDYIFVTPETKVISFKLINGKNRQVLTLHYKIYNHSFNVDVVCVQRQTAYEIRYDFPDGNLDQILRYYIVVYNYQKLSTINTVRIFSSRNIIPSFKSRLKDRCLISGGYYKFYVHFINKYGEYSDGIPIKRHDSAFSNSSAFNGETIDDDYLFIVDDRLITNSSGQFYNMGDYLVRKLYTLIDKENLNLSDDIKGFFISYERYSDINNFYGILTAYDFKKDNTTDAPPLNFTNYSEEQSNKYIYRFYCDEIDAADVLQLKSSKLVVYLSEFNNISNKYDSSTNDKLLKNGIFEDKHTADLLSIYFLNDYDIHMYAKYNITDIKYISAHSFTKDNDYRGGYLELTLDTEIDELFSDKKVNLAKLISNDKFLYGSENKTLIKFTNVFYFEDIYNTEPVYEQKYLIDKYECSKGLNGFVTFGKSLIYNNDKVILNDGYNVLVNSKYNAYTGSTNINEDNTGKINNDNKYLFVGQYSYPIIKEYMLETKRFKTAPEIIITRNEKLSSTVSQNVFAFSTSTIVKPMNLTDLYELPVGSQDIINPKTYINFVDGFVTKFDKRVVRSNPIADESFKNSWRTISPEAYKDITENKGNITNIVAMGTVLLVHTEHGIFIFDRDNTLKNGEDNKIQLSMPDIFDLDYKEVISSQYGACGLQDSDAWILDEFGYIFYDNDAHRFYKFGSKQIEIIDNSIQQFINKYKPHQVRFINDSESNRILINIRYHVDSNDNIDLVEREITLSYNTKINKWISRHTYCFDRGFSTKQMTYFIVDRSIDNTDDRISNIYVINRDIISHQNINAISNGNYSEFQNVRINQESNKYPSSISVIVNDSYELIKTLEYISWKLYKIELNSSSDKSFNFEPRDIIKIPYSGDTLRVYNDNIDTGVIDVKIDTEDKKNTSVMNYKKPWWQYDNWNFNYLRNIKNAKEIKAKFMSRLYGNYFIINFTFSDDFRRIEFETLDCNLITNKTI